MRASRRALIAGLVIAAAIAWGPASARKPSFLDRAVEAIEGKSSVSVPAVGTQEVAFSPNEGSEALVVRVLDSAKSEIRMLAYSFTSPAVTEALLRARHRGVDVAIVADEKENTSADRSGKARAALSALVNAGCDVRLVRAFAIHHDKLAVVDKRHTELGSFNYSQAAARSNSETVFVNWDSPRLAAVFLEHFDRNQRLAHPFSARY